MITDSIEIAAAYLFYFCSNPAFVDGNKLVALATALVFLSENGHLPSEALDAKDWENLTIAVAAGALGREEVAATLCVLLS